MITDKNSQADDFSTDEVIDDPAGQDVLVVVADYYSELTDGLLRGASVVFDAAQEVEQTAIIAVPGSFEIPVAVAKFLPIYRPKGVLVLGVVIEGETAHAGMIVSSVTSALQGLAVDNLLPIADGIVHVSELAVAAARCADDEKNRGREAANNLLKMIELMQKADALGGK